MTVIGPVETSELVDNMLKEITGLKASVNKYKKRAELANARADMAEKEARDAKAYADVLTHKLTNARHRLHTALTDMA